MHLFSIRIANYTRRLIVTVSMFQGYVNIAYDEDKQMINQLVYENDNGTQKQFQLLEDFNQVRIVPMKKIRINLKY